MTRDEIIKGLECHKRAMYGEIDEHGFACNSCPYKDMESTCHARTEGRLMNDALALLKAETIVRCDECEYAGSIGDCLLTIGPQLEGCLQGKRRQDDDER